MFEELTGKGLVLPDDVGGRYSCGPAGSLALLMRSPSGWMCPGGGGHGGVGGRPPSGGSRERQRPPQPVCLEHHHPVRGLLRGRAEAGEEPCVLHRRAAWRQEGGWVRGGSQPGDDLAEWASLTGAPVPALSFSRTRDRVLVHLQTIPRILRPRVETYRVSR